MGGGTKAGGEGTTAGDRGVGKDEESCGGVRGRRSLWALEGSYITLSPSPISTSFKKALFCPPAPPSPNQPLRSPQDLKSLILQVRLQGLPLQLLPQLQRRPFQPTCNPSKFRLGALNGYISVRLRTAKRAHQPHRPPFVPTLGKST